MSIIGAGLLLGVVPAHADVQSPIEVPCGKPGMEMLVANLHAAAEDSVDKTFVLAKDCTYGFNSPVAQDNGMPTNNAFPPVKTKIAIQGNGATIQRIPTSLNRFRLFEVDSRAELSLENVTLQHGHVHGAGAALHNQGTVTLKSVKINDSKAQAGGGAIHNRGTLSLEDTVIDEAIVWQDSGTAAGGGIYNGGGAVTLKNSKVSRATAMGATSTKPQGGGIYTKGGTVTLDSSEITGNEAVDGNSLGSRTVNGEGGGIYNDGGAVTLKNSKVTGNTAHGSQVSKARGGGVFLNDGTLDVDADSKISGNTAKGSDAGGLKGIGGGVYVVSGTATLAAGSVDGNEPDNCVKKDGSSC